MNATATAKARTNGYRSAKKYGDHSIKKIGELLKVDWRTVQKKLEALKYKPIQEKATLKIYRFDETMELALTGTTDKLVDVRIRKESAAAEKIELAVAEARGELASVSEFTDAVQRIFGTLHKEVVIRMPTRLSHRLAKAKTPQDVKAILMTDLDRVFNVLRNDHAKYLGKK